MRSETQIRRNSIRLIISLIVVLNSRCKGKETISARFPGESQALEKYIAENLHWNQEQLTVEGKVFISFIVTERGQAKQLKIEKSLNANCDSAAVQLVKCMPDWLPAKENGRPINSKVMLAIPFKLYKEK